MFVCISQIVTCVTFRWLSLVTQFFKVSDPVFHCFKVVSVIYSSKLQIIYCCNQNLIWVGTGCVYECAGGGGGGEFICWCCFLFLKFIILYIKHINFHAKTSMFTALQVHMHTSLSYTWIGKEREKKNLRKTNQASMLRYNIVRQVWKTLRQTVSWC